MANSFGWLGGMLNGMGGYGPSLGGGLQNQLPWEQAPQGYRQPFDEEDRRRRAQALMDQYMAGQKSAQETYRAAMAAKKELLGRTLLTWGETYD